ncbi:hypothetical protein A3860_17425 [Niastella vici]|uniref:DUF3085 domain-containing protein n=1 Tax=Niastella vici TaxID=1703345 RepID=A0A1V9G470_9BACT|nr:DUF3085 domain-containing protein [Niastella vici]OQP65445.1 hypothetical protein A3860_17425 [Niastella vici]
MALLIFKNEKLRTILKISEQATEFKSTFPEAVETYKFKTGKDYEPGVNLTPYYTQTKATLWLVKDTGVYLMTSAKLDKMPEDDSHLCYAEGFAPTDPGWFNKSATAMGSDDFVEAFELELFKQGIQLGGDIHIKINRTALSIELVIPGKKKK